MTSRMAGADPATAGALTVTALSSHPAGVLVVRVAGEVDLATLGQLREQLHRHLPGSHRGVVLDFTGVSFLAACGIGLLLGLAEQAHSQGMKLCLVANGRAVLRALEATGVEGLVPHAATVAEAVAQCSAYSPPG